MQHAPDPRAHCGSAIALAVQMKVMVIRAPCGQPDNVPAEELSYEAGLRLHATTRAFDIARCAAVPCIVSKTTK
jgi:hypothetical protein